MNNKTLSQIFIYFSCLFLFESCSDYNRTEKSLENQKVKLIDTLKVEDHIIIDVQNGKEEWNLMDANNGKTIENHKKTDEQEYFYYHSFIDSIKIGIEQGFEDTTSKHKVIYLGSLKDVGNGEIYHVIRDFWTIQLAMNVKGHSDLIFIRESNHFTAVYDLEIPDDLPFQISENALFFMDQAKLVKWQFKDGLPPCLCPGDKGCACI